jgi:hypothetical protein
MATQPSSAAGNLQAALSPGPQNAQGGSVDLADLGFQPDAGGAAAQPLQSAAQPSAQQGGGVDLSDLGFQPDDAAKGTAPGTITGQTATISAPQQPASVMGRLAQWIDNVALDMKDGGDRTGVGTVLQKLGAHGLDSGNSQAVGDFMASLPLGMLKAAKGAAELVPSEIGGETGNTWKGVEDLVGGGLQALAEPAAFVAPEESALSEEGLLSDAADAASAASSSVGDKVSQLTSRIIASRQAAGDALGEINEAIGDHPVAADDAVDIANNILDKQATGAKLGGLKKQLVQFMDRATDPDDPLTFSEAREFEQNFQQLTPAQKMNLGAGVKPLLANLRSSLRQSIEDVADAGGQGDKFRSAMQAYRVAAQGEKAVDALKGTAGRQILKGAAEAIGVGAGSAAATAAYKAYNGK